MREEDGGKYPDLFVMTALKDPSLNMVALMSSLSWVLRKKVSSGLSFLASRYVFNDFSSNLADAMSWRRRLAR